MPREARMPSPDHTLTSLDELEALYGSPDPRSRAKETDQLTAPYRAFVEAAPFAVLATRGPDGLDCSPRGDAPGFVRVADPHTLLLPDRRGNNRIDSLRNILADPAVSLLFLIPGIGETLRVNGTARISTDPDLLDGFSVQGRVPRTILVIRIASVFFQCSRAVVRADLWNSDARARRDGVPTAGAMLAAASGDRHGGPAYDDGLADRVRATLY
ncbi:pyridoxamine 5'-phosphate oxidase family protein [Methylobacterium nodulans]|uniref:Pyridoxamine 5'-phosphate oxidase-related FMN-binding n=1 Tax=Methylobacterium nodulans (strain LMG 21967 / CNCM I-2342 / ORS 2060) TaxID=460265 RepID=B8IHB2_METNO|nr:pyridoxamine 5'-phosphate oxidase family protein [Methylobacterium nodulans]ACL59804.1 pyridoxamine 5'-phosphate oxidase-related FMN-binding [Methylobacterium nodulans ORS 2060]